MNRKERRAAEKRGGPAVTPMAATLAQAFRAHQAGHRSEAEKLYRDVLAIEPTNAAALHLLGALMHQSGKTDEAVSLIRQAIAIDPHDPDFHYNLGSILNAAGRMEDAIEPLSRATALKPNYVAAQFELGNALARTGRLSEAEAPLQRVVQLQPDNADAMNNLARVLWNTGQREDAMALWQRAAQRQPANALVQFNIASAEMELGRPEAAEASLRRALAAKPKYPEATQLLAAVLLSQGKTGEALSLASEALSALETNETRLTFIQCLRSVGTFTPDATLRDRLRRALVECWIQPSEFAPICASVLKAHSVIGPAVRRVAEQWTKASVTQQHPVISDTEIAAVAKPLFTAYLESTPNCDIDLERFLSALRATLLDRAVNGESAPDQLIDVCAALARQCFVNGYVFNEYASESTRVAQLITAVQSAIRSKEHLPPLQLAALAMYRPLHDLEGGARLPERDWPASVAALLQQQIAEAQEEAALLPSTRKLTAIDDTETVRERDVHPRWINGTSTLAPLALRNLLRQRLVPGDAPALAQPPAPDILIAGCGTGLQAATAAQNYRDARILAIDPSAANLAYARRQAARMKLDNIEFAQADILKLDTIDRRFDVIEAGLALNYLADPFAGWRALNALLRPGGVIRLALYSEIARRDLAAARELAAAGNYQTDLEGVRLCRQAILRLPEDAKARHVTRAGDFYSTGGFRDLTLRKEHPVSLPAIQAFLSTNNLEFIGFEADDLVRRSFAQRFPDPSARKDLAAWQQFEAENPDSFAALYVFWTRKPS